LCGRGDEGLGLADKRYKFGPYLGKFRLANAAFASCLPRAPILAFNLVRQYNAWRPSGDFDLKRISFYPSGHWAAYDQAGSRIIARGTQDHRRAVAGLFMSGLRIEF